MNRKGTSHAMIENGTRYWFDLIGHTARRYARTRRPVAFIRAVGRTILTGHYGEMCGDCGRPYLLWWVDEPGIWELVADNPFGGLFCPNCFDRRARSRGLILQWSPRRFTAGQQL